MTLDELMNPMSSDELRPLLAAAATWWKTVASHPEQFATANFWSAVGSRALDLLVSRGVLTREEALEDLADFVVHIDRLSERLEEESKEE